ncbi:MAG: Glu/Leu/Phe/Val family dehydrogenase, partial [Bryobacteraceae bacterium]
VSEEELRLLARAMTLKFGLLGLPQGGAKAGVRGDPEVSEEQRLARLRQFVLAIRPLLSSRLYLPCADMGTDNRIIRRVLVESGVPLRHRELRGSRSGYWTACGVLGAARAACRHAGLDLAGCTVAIEGFGAVGSALAQLLARAGATVVAISTSRGALYCERGLDVDRLVELARESGSGVVERYQCAERIPRERLLEVEADLLLPCARHHTIHAGNVAHVRAPIVVPGANVPMTPEAEAALEARGVLCVPDFVANAGGTLGSTMEFAGMPESSIRRMAERAVADLAAWVLREAPARGLTLRKLAERVALERHAQIREDAERGSLGRLLFATALELYRRGVIPAALVGRLAPHYFARIARL